MKITFKSDEPLEQVVAVVQAAYGVEIQVGALPDGMGEVDDPGERVKQDRMSGPTSNPE